MKTIGWIAVIATFIAAWSFGQTMANLVGDWTGTLDAGGVRLRLAVHIVKGADGGFRATLDSLDQGAMGIPVDTVTLDGNALKLELKALRATYEAILSADGRELTGQWKQSSTLPLNLERADPAKQAPARPPAPLTAEERSFLIGQLEKTRQEFANAVKGLTPAQWKFKPSPERWSVAECAEHILIEEDFLFRMATQQLLKIPPAPDQKPATREQDEAILKFLADRTQKMKAAEQFLPKGNLAGPDEAIAQLTQIRQRVVEYVRTTSDDLRAHSTANPQFGRLDAYQYLLTLSGHTGRHVAQMLEVRADAGWPRQ